MSDATSYDLGQHEAEQWLMDEFREALEADYKAASVFAVDPTEGITWLAAQLGRIAKAYEESGAAVDMHHEAVKLMVLAYRFAIESWQEDDGEEDI